MTSTKRDEADSAAAGAAGICVVAAIDLVFVLVMIAILIWGCPVLGQFSIDDSTTLALYHLVHLALITGAFIVFAIKALFVPIWFVLIAIFTGVLDVYALVTRFTNLFILIVNVDACNIILLFFDGVFFAFSFFYIAYGIQSIIAYGNPIGPWDEIVPLSNAKASSSSSKSPEIYRESFAGSDTADSQRSLLVKLKSAVHH